MFVLVVSKKGNVIILYIIKILMDSGIGWILKEKPHKPIERNRCEKYFFSYFFIVSTSAYRLCR
jgi:hypothetical protein